MQLRPSAPENALGTTEYCLLISVTHHSDLPSIIIKLKVRRFSFIAKYYKKQHNAPNNVFWSALLRISVSHSEVVLTRDERITKRMKNYFYVTSGQAESVTAQSISLESN